MVKLARPVPGSTLLLARVFPGCSAVTISDVVPMQQGRKSDNKIKKHHFSKNAKRDLKAVYFGSTLSLSLAKGERVVREIVVNKTARAISELVAAPLT